MARANKLSKQPKEKDLQTQDEFDNGVGLYGGSELPLPSNDTPVKQPCHWCGATDWELVDIDGGYLRTSCCQSL